MTSSKEDSERVLVLAPFGRDAVAAVTVLESAHLEAVACKDMAALVAGLNAGAGAAVIAEEAFRTSAAEVAAWVQRQPPWSDFPFMLLTSQRSSSEATSQRGELMALLRNVSFLERPLQTVSFISACRAALRARSRQYQLRALLRERDRTATELERQVGARTADLVAANDRLRAESAEREAAQAALLHAQKMEALGMMTGGVAHDFNNLLTAVIGNLDLAISRVTDERVRRQLSGALEAAQRGARLTSQLLAFSRRQALTPQALDLNALIVNLEPMLASTLGSSVRLQLDLDRRLWITKADQTQIELAILNLAVNARDAMPEGGLLKITTRNVVLKDENRDELPAGPYVVVEVEDAGSGIDPETLTRVMEPFFTTKPLGRGTGLGLSQVYGLARQLGGTVKIDSEVGRGTTVTIYLPKTDEPISDRPALPTERSSIGLTILVVDDDSLVRTSAARMLESLGCAVVQAECGADALHVMGEDRAIDLVLTDLRMPDVRGSELYRQLRTTNPELPIVIMTGFADLEEIPPDAPLLRKPFVAEDLAQILAGALYRPRSELQRALASASPHGGGGQGPAP